MRKMHLDIGIEYLIIDDFDVPVVMDSKILEEIKPYVYLGYEQHLDKHIFHSKSMDVEKHIEPRGVYSVYYSIDDFLHTLVEAVDKVNTDYLEEGDSEYSFSDDMKCKIRESQEKHPEIWI